MNNNFLRDVDGEMVEAILSMIDTTDTTTYVDEEKVVELLIEGMYNGFSKYRENENTYFIHVEGEKGEAIFNRIKDNLDYSMCDEIDHEITRITEDVRLIGTTLEDMTITIGTDIHYKKFLYITFTLDYNYYKYLTYDYLNLIHGIEYILSIDDIIDNEKFKEITYNYNLGNDKEEVIDKLLILLNSVCVYIDSYNELGIDTYKYEDVFRSIAIDITKDDDSIEVKITKL